MTHTDRQRPREMVARAIEDAGMAWLRNAIASRTNKFEAFGWADVPNEVFAKAAIDELRRLGFIHSESLALIKQEEGAE